jgi:hypothetical protein
VLALTRLPNLYPHLRYILGSLPIFVPLL